MRWSNALIVTTSRTGDVLYDHQRKSVEEVLRVWEHGALVGTGTARGALLADPMGLGKTASAVVAVYRASMRRVLVVCPKSAIPDWTREIANWHPNPRRIRILSQHSKRTVNPNVGWYLTNYEQLEHHAADLRARAWDLLILDEAHATKEPERKRTILIHGGIWRGKTYSAIPARKALVVTGTPMKNRVEELFTSLHFLDPANWPDRDEFIETFYENPLVTPEGRVVQNIAPRYLNELHILLKRSVLVRTSKDQVPGMPSRRFEKVEVPLDDVVERDWFDEKAKKLLKLSRKLRSKQSQYNRHPTQALRDEIRDLEERQREIRSAIYQHATRAKRHAVLDYLLKLPPEHKAVVIGFHRDLLLDQLARALHQRCRRFVLHHGGNSKNVAKTVRAFQDDPQVQFFLGQLNVSNLSLTLTAASHVVFIEIPQTRADFDQAFDRVHRIGQKAPECTATVFSVMWPSAGDEDLLDALLHWKDRASQVLDGKETDMAWDWHLPVEHKPDDPRWSASCPRSGRTDIESWNVGTHFRPA